MTPRDSIDFSAIRVLDGGMATELERRGCDISGPLWSAHVLDQSPQPSPPSISTTSRWR